MIANGNVFVAILSLAKVVSSSLAVLSTYQLLKQLFVIRSPDRAYETLPRLVQVSLQFLFHH